MKVERVICFVDRIGSKVAEHTLYNRFVFFLGSFLTVVRWDLGRPERISCEDMRPFSSIAQTLHFGGQQRYWAFPNRL
jgi:hypothetical protein